MLAASSASSRTRLERAQAIAKRVREGLIDTPTGVGTFTDWLNYEWAVGDLRWLTLDPKRVETITDPHFHHLAESCDSCA
jgi:hypothetical protein